LQASLDKRFAHGLQFTAAYTFSKSIDQASSFEGILNPIDPRRSRSLSGFDARHRLVLSYYYELPFRKFSGASGTLLNGWAVSGITTPSSFSEDNILGRIGNSPRTICCGPHISQTDFAILKTFPVKENMRVDFRAEFFNIFNHTQFYNPAGNFSDGAQFGQVSQVRDPRLAQFALKFFF
jgi:hypothetical protein